MTPDPTAATYRVTLRAPAPYLLAAGIVALFLTAHPALLVVAGLVVMGSADAIGFGMTCRWIRPGSSAQRVYDLPPAFETAVQESTAAYRVLQKAVNLTTLAFVLLVSLPAGLALALAMWMGAHDWLYHAGLGTIKTPWGADRAEAVWWKWWTPAGLAYRLLGRVPTRQVVTLQAWAGFVAALTLTL